MESLQLETIIEFHALATQVFIPFTVTRLQQRREDTETVLTIELRGITEETSPIQQLCLSWEKASIPELPLAMQENRPGSIRDEIGVTRL